MKLKNRKIGHLLLFVLIAVIVLISLIVLPFADTENPDADVGNEVSGAAITLGKETTGSAIVIGKETTGAAIDVDDKETKDVKDNDDKKKNDDEEKKKEKKTKYVYQNDDIIVTAVFLNEDAAPDNAQFCVNPITEETNKEQYSTISAEVNDNVEAENKVVTSFLAYDIYFMADGNKYEPELGNVKVTIQYKKEMFDKAVQKATDQIKVLHLKETNTGVRVEDVTGEVNIVNNSSCTEVSGSAINVDFSTGSFSTFVVTGVSSSNSVINVTMKFIDNSGAVNTNISGQYYLNVTDPFNNRYNAELNVVNGKVNTKISGLYNQNGLAQNDGSLYPLMNGNYTAVLYKYPSNCTPNFKWEDSYINTVGCVKYELGAELIENYRITEFSNAITVSEGEGSLAITATEKSGTQFSNAEILGALTPIRPYAVFAKQLDLIVDMEGCIAVQKAKLDNNFGNSYNNINKYNCSTVRTITINKTYNGTVQKTFKFGLFKDNALCGTTTITLPTSSGGNMAEASFTGIDTTSNYSVYELGDNNTKLAIGDTYDGYTLSSIESQTDTTSSTINNTSYVETILSSVPTALRSGTSQQKNCLVVGAGYSIVKEDNNICIYEGSKKWMSAESAYCDFKAANGSFPIDFDTILNSMANLSINLAKAISSDTVMVKNMTIAELNSKINNELTINTNGRMLLLNIDASGSNDISLASASARLIVNGENCGGWSNQANNVIVNIFNKNGETYSAYTGNITNAGFMMGILLAPYARVNSMGQNFNGNIVANYVRNDGGEIHGNTMGTIFIKILYKIVNTSELNIVLPLTGGTGSFLFYLFGGAIILLAAAFMSGYLINRKKHYKESG